MERASRARPFRPTRLALPAFLALAALTAACRAAERARDPGAWTPRSPLERDFLAADLAPVATREELPSALADLVPPSGSVSASSGPGPGVDGAPIMQGLILGGVAEGVAFALYDDPDTWFGWLRVLVIARVDPADPGRLLESAYYAPPPGVCDLEDLRRRFDQVVRHSAVAAAP